MPYIKKERKFINFALFLWVNTPGELTYVFQQAIRAYLETKGESYQTYAEILGALDGVRIDFVRRKIEPYEIKKEKENGDVWE